MDYLIIPVKDIQDRIDEIDGYGVFIDEFDLYKQFAYKELLEDYDAIYISRHDLNKIVNEHYKDDINEK